MSAVRTSRQSSRSHLPSRQPSLTAPAPWPPGSETEVETVYHGPAQPEPEENDGPSALSDRLTSELTAHRTLALRHALGEQPDVAFLASLHALCLKIFYPYAPDSCLELDLKSVGFSAQLSGLNDTELVAALRRRHQAWLTALPKEPADLWDVLTGFELDSRQALFAHCVAISVNAAFEPYNRRPRALAHADRLAQALDLDMVQAGWVPTVETYLGRVTKARILDAVREARGERAAKSIDHLKKAEMAEKAQALLTGSGWLPEVLRTPGRPLSAPTAEAENPPGAETAALEEEMAMVPDGSATEDEAAGTAPSAEAAE
jgi:ParB family chromosome partitioning protein